MVELEVSNEKCVDPSCEVLACCEDKADSRADGHNTGREWYLAHVLHLLQRLSCLFSQVPFFGCPESRGPQSRRGDWPLVLASLHAANGVYESYDSQAGLLKDAQ